MSTASRSFDKLPGPVKRLLFSAAALALFLAVSAMLNPDRSLADAKAVVFPETTAAAPGGQPIITPRASAGHPLLGTLVGSPYHIWVYAGKNGPVYTVANTAGKILAQEVTAEELYEQVPGAAVDKLRLQALTEGTNIMVVPDNHDRE
jgi:hypothetical protein